MSTQKVHATSGADAEIEAARLASDKPRALKLLMAHYGAGIHRIVNKACEDLIRALPLVGKTKAAAEPVGILDRDLGAVVSAGDGYQVAELSVHCSCHPSSTQVRWEIAQ